MGHLLTYPNRPTASNYKRLHSSRPHSSSLLKLYIMLLTSSSSFILPGQVLGKYSYLSSSMRGILVAEVVSLPHWGWVYIGTNVKWLTCRKSQECSIEYLVTFKNKTMAVCPYVTNLTSLLWWFAGHWGKNSESRRRAGDWAGGIRSWAVRGLVWLLASAGAQYRRITQYRTQYRWWAGHLCTYRGMRLMSPSRHLGFTSLRINLIFKSYKCYLEKCTQHSTRHRHCERWPPPGDCRRAAGGGRVDNVWWPMLWSSNSYSFLCFDTERYFTQVYCEILKFIHIQIHIHSSVLTQKGKGLL